MSYTSGRFWTIYIYKNRINEQMGSEPSTALFSPVCSSLTSSFPTYYTHPRPYFDLLSHVEAIRDKPAQYISMGAWVSVQVVTNMEALPCLQIGPFTDLGRFPEASDSARHPAV